MASETAKSLRVILQSVVDDLKRDYVQKGLPASGRFAREARVVGSRKFGAAIQLPGYTFFITERPAGQKQGRAPGRFPPIDAIEQWVQDKKLQGRDRRGRFISNRALAFLISRKIAEQGTEIYLRRRQGLDLQSIIDERFKVQHLPDAIRHDMIIQAGDALARQQGLK